MTKSKMFGLLGGAGLLVLLIAFFNFIGWTKIEGNERVVVQDWKTGVENTILGPGTSFYIPVTTTHYKYNIGTEKFIMGDMDLYNKVGSETVDYPAFTVTTGGRGKEQPASFSITLQYRLDPIKLVKLHNQAQNNYEDLIIKPALSRIISDQATELQVLDFYSGEGRVALQKNIEKAITDHPSLSEVGIRVETFVIDRIKLDPDFVSEITGRQLATQKKLRAIEEAKAAQERAKQVEAEAQADKLKRIVQAEAKKQEQIKAAEASNESRILAAKAQAEEIREKAAADRFRKEQDAKGALALGLAEAKVEKEKKMSKYDGVAGARQAAVEIEQAKTDRLKNAKISGIVSEKTFLMMAGDGLNSKSGNNGPVVTVPVRN